MTTTTANPSSAIDPSATVPKPISLGHVFLQTTAARFPAMVAFYKAFLSASATHEADGLAFLTYDREHHRVAIGALPGVVERPDDGGPPPPAAPVAGVRHVAFTYASLADLAGAYRVRKERDGVVPYWCVNHGMTTSMYYRDPDGGGLEVQVDNFDTPEEACAYMRTEAFKKNPLGVDYDPDELVRRLESGESEKEIKRLKVDVGARALEDRGLP